MDRYTAEALYPGAVVMNGLDLGTVATITRKESPRRSFLRITFEPKQPHVQGDVTSVYPDHEFLLAQVPEVTWAVHVPHLPGYPDRPACHLMNPCAVRAYGSSTFAGQRHRLVEQHRLRTYRPIRATELPGPGVPTPQPAGQHDRRGYAFQGFVPPFLATGDAVRTRYAELQDAHDRAHGFVREGTGRDTREADDLCFTECLDCTPRVYDSMLQEVTIRCAFHEVALEDLPHDVDRVLTSAMAYERMVLMGTITPRLRTRIGHGITDGDLVEYRDESAGSEFTTRRARVVQARAETDSSTRPQALIVGLNNEPFRHPLSALTRLDLTATYREAITTP